MKKLSLAALLMSCALIGGCALEQNPAESPEIIETEEENRDFKMVQALPSGLDLNNLTDAILHVSFDAKSAYLNDEGALVMDLHVFIYDTYDSVDITSLEEGDQIVVKGESVPIASLDTADETVRINGGESTGGVELFADDGGTFYAGGANDTKNYYEIGTVTLLVDTECVLIDDADLDNRGKTLYAGDLLSLEEDSVSYSPYNTTVRVDGGKIVEIHRVYIP
ncbi:MAG: hypothetical protein ACI4EO_09705 [Blautia sp.]